MTLTIRGAEIPLGVECAWPCRIDSQPSGSTLRRLRLAETWRRLLSVLRSSRRRGWAG